MDKNVFYIMAEKYDRFTKTFRIISDYIKENYTYAAFLSIQELSEKMGISPASITRFSRELGYSGFHEFQKEIQKITQKEIIPMKEIKNSISDLLNDDEILKTTIDLNIKNLQETYNNALDESFRKSVELISNGRRIYIIGLRSSYCVAYYLYFMLADFMDNIVLLSAGTADVFDRISNVNKDDVLVAIGFSKYTKLTYQVLKFFCEKSDKTIAVTDSYSSPLAVKSKVVLLTANSSTTFSFVSAMTVLNALIIAVGRKDKQRTLNILEEKKKILLENDIHI